MTEIQLRPTTEFILHTYGTPKIGQPKNSHEIAQDQIKSKIARCVNYLRERQKELINHCNVKGIDGYADTRCERVFNDVNDTIKDWESALARATKHEMSETEVVAFYNIDLNFTCKKIGDYITRIIPKKGFFASIFGSDDDTSDYNSDVSGGADELHWGFKALIGLLLVLMIILICYLVGKCVVEWGWLSFSAKTTDGGSKEKMLDEYS